MSEPVTVDGTFGAPPRRPGLRAKAVGRALALLQSSASVAVLLVLWELLVRVLSVPKFLLPSPTEILARTIELMPLLGKHAWVTLFEILVGFVVAVIGGAVLGTVVGFLRLAERALNPVILFFQVVPKSALAPLLIIWLGTGIMPKVVLVFLIAFFPVLIQMLAGIRSVDERVTFLVRSTRAPWHVSFFKIVIPHSLPYVFAGMRVAITLSVVGAIVAEFVASQEGLGHLMLVAFGTLDTSAVISVLMVLSLMAMGLYAAIGFAESLVIPWHVSQRGKAE